MKHEKSYLLKSPEYAGYRDYWRARFEQVHGRFHLSDFLLLPGTGTATRAHEQKLTSEAQTRLDKIARGSDLGLFVVFYAALQGVLQQYTEQGTLVIECPPLSDEDGIAAEAGDTLPLVSQPGEATTFRDLISQARECVSQAYQFQDFPVWDLVANPGQFRSDVLITSRFLHPEAKPDVRYTLAIEIIDGTAFRASSPSGLLPGWFLANLCGHLDRSLGLLEPDTNLSELGEIIDEDVQPAVAEFNRGRTTNYQETVVEVFARQVERYPEHTAVIFHEQRLSYAELDEASDKLAGYLIEKFDIERGQVVAVLSMRSHWTIVAIMGILKAGAVYLPIAPDTPEERFERILRDAEAKAMLLHSSHLETAMLCPEVPMFAMDLQMGMLNPPTIPFPRKVGVDDLAYIIYTSGTTGVPKGVMIPHGGLSNVALDHVAVLDMVPEDRYLQFMAHSFDGSLLDIFTVLLSGAALVLVDNDTIRDLDRFTDYMAHHRVSLTTMTPSYLQLLKPERMRGLRALVSAGEPARAEQARFYSQRLAFYNGYGPTEASVNATLYKVEPNQSHDVIPIGSPSAHKYLYILDRQMRPKPPGVPGEIYIAGVGLARGYVKDAPATAMRFLMNPFGDGTRIYRTGDFGSWTPDGQIHFRGRHDNQVKINGIRIDLNEIQKCLAEHPGIQACEVLTRENQGQNQLVGYYKKAEQTELIPSLGEYGIYDIFLYESMAKDRMREEGYKRALAEAVAGKVVLDPGTGRELILARHAVAAGARHVYAVEIDRDAYEAARTNLVSYGLEDKITLILGDISQISLPEEIDTVVSALAGNIATADGCIPLVNKIKSRLVGKPDFIPNRYVTQVAAYHLEAQTLLQGFSEISQHYVSRVFDKVGHPFDIRLCMNGVQAEKVLSGAQHCEDLDYGTTLSEAVARQLVLRVERAGQFSGLLLWLEAYHGETLMIDSLQKTHHRPVYLPIRSAEPLWVEDGDEIELIFRRQTAADGLHPDYYFEGVVKRSGKDAQTFTCDAPHLPSTPRQHPLYEMLLDGEGHPRPALETSARGIRDFLMAKLPEYMCPQRMIEVEAWPLTAHGKVDTKQLASLSDHIVQDRERALPRNAMERQLCAIWQQTLGQEVGIDDNFFGLGGDSIRVIQVVHEARKLGLILDSADLMSQPSIRELSDILQTRTATQETPAQRTEQPWRLPPEFVAGWPEGFQDGYPASSMQRLMLEAYEQDEALDGIYHCCAVWHLQDQDLEVRALRAAIQHLYDTRPNLRTRFCRTSSGEVYQLLRAREALDVELFDHRIGQIALEDSYFRKVFERDIANRFEGYGLAQPLIRFSLYWQTEHTCAVVVSFHHAILDGWSGVELRNSLLQFYDQFKRNEAPEPEERYAETHKQFVALEHDCQGEESYRAFWQARLSEIAEPSQTNRAKNLQTHYFSFPNDLVAQMKGYASSQGVSMKTIFLESAAQALMRVVGTPKLTLGLVTNGRTEKLVDPLRAVGLFWNVVPYTTERSRTIAVKEVQDRLNEIDRFGNYPGVLQPESGREHNLPCFNFIHFHNEKKQDGCSLIEGIVNDRFSNPLTLVVALDGEREHPQAELHVERDTAYMSEAELEQTFEYWKETIATQCQSGAE